MACEGMRSSDIVRWERGVVESLSSSDDDEEEEEDIMKVVVAAAIVIVVSSSDSGSSKHFVNIQPRANEAAVKGTPENIPQRALTRLDWVSGFD